jgi:hypothetical protein
MLGTDTQKHGTLKDIQRALCHAGIQTTGNVYVQTIETSVLSGPRRFSPPRNQRSVRSGSDSRTLHLRIAN